MAKVNLTGMNVEALMNLRNQIDERLLELRTKLEKQLAALHGQPKGKAIRIGSSLKGKKVTPKYRSLKARPGPVVAQNLVGLLLRSKVERNSTTS